MATITDRKLSIAHDHRKKTAKVTVTCKINFTTLELCQMKACKEARFFKLKCQLWGDDPWSDDHLLTLSKVFFFPDGNPSSPETRKFEVTVGEGLLDEDWGRDEVYGKLLLYNLLAGTILKKKTNTVKHHF